MDDLKDVFGELGREDSETMALDQALQAMPSMNVSLAVSSAAEDSVQPSPQQQQQLSDPSARPAQGRGKRKKISSRAMVSAPTTSTSDTTTQPSQPPGSDRREGNGDVTGGAESRAPHIKLEDIKTEEEHHAVKNTGEVRLPLEVNTKVECRWRDGRYHPARIIERRKGLQSDDPSHYEYYVHYEKMNRRMDEWVTQGHLDLSTVELEPGAEGEGAARTRTQKRKMDDMSHDDEGHADFDPNALREHEEFTKVKNIESIELGQYEMDTWYFSPFPPEYRDCKKLYFCEYTLQFFKTRPQMLFHLRKCRIRHPPGDEIYRNDHVAMFEVDGKKEKIYCQNLCYLAKLFLDHKTLYYDVDLFLFYILCELDERGAHIVGYFSKEKCSEEGYNLACILTLPSHQRKGYGKFLISMSYELSKIEGKVGTPERPLSDLGRVSYLGYWTRVLLGLLGDHEGTISIKDLSDLTAIRAEDIITTLQQLNLIQYQKGNHVICAAPSLIKKYLKQAGSAGLVVDPGKIIWTPYNAEREYQSFRG